MYDLDFSLNRVYWEYLQHKSTPYSYMRPKKGYWGSEQIPVTGCRVTCPEYKQKNQLDVTLGTQFLVIPQSMGEATALARRLKDLGVDNLQIKLYSHHPLSNNDLVVDIEDYTALEADLMNFDSEDFKINFR